MSKKIITTMTAALLLASTGLAFAKDRAPRHDRQHTQLQGYYNMAPGAYAAPNPGWDNASDPFGVVVRRGGVW